MLYDRWQQIVCEHRHEFALADASSGRRWTFADLAASAEKVEPVVDPSRSGVVVAGGQGVDFILQTLAAWRLARVLCPVEPGSAPPSACALPTGVAHLKLTSATTGQARAVLFTGPQLAADASQIVATMGLRPDWPNLSCISLAHSYGFSNLVLPLLLHGIPLVLLESPLPETVRRALADWSAVTLPAVPALWRTWAEAGVLSSKICLAISAGAPLPVQLEQATFESAGLKIHNFYGSTECGGIAYDRSTKPRADAACIGASMDHVELALGDSGCLEVRSPAVGLGYWPDPSPALADGCFRTSDLAELRDGLIHLQGRAGDLINIAGRKVAPESIEQVLRAHHDVADCLVFGVPDPAGGRGDRIVACVVARSAQGRNEESLRQFLLSRIPAWQVPREWKFVDDLAPNRRGKLSRAQWRARLGYSG